MPEILLVLTILIAGYLYTRLLRTRIAKIFCLIVASSFVLGHGMNILVIRANGGKMPVLEGKRDWDNAPTINLPGPIDSALFDSYLPTMQKIILLTDEPHRVIPVKEVPEISFAALADQYPIKIGYRHSLYSLGDVFIVLGSFMFWIGILPIWLISRMSRKNRTP